MEFLCYHRDRRGSDAMRTELVETHWSYMDRFADLMVARGPVLAADGDTALGSVHVLDLPDPAAARAFALDEPYYQAGVYRDVLLRRWRNVLGRTMWEFPGGLTDRPRWFVLGLGGGPDGGPAADLDGPATGSVERDALIAYGPLLADDGATWLGTAAMVETPDEDRARSVLTAGRYADVEVHRWDFGGRPDA